MAKSERIQIPISLQKKKELEAKSEQLGFDTATDAVRFLINNFLKGSINLSLNSEYIELLDSKTEREVLEAIEEMKQDLAITIDPRDPDFHQKMINFANKHK